MDTGKKVAIGATFVVLAVVGVRVEMIHRERVAANAPVEAPMEMHTADEFVYLKKMHPDSLKDEKDLIGKPLWVSAGAQMDYYPYVGHRVEYGTTVGTLLAAEMLTVKDAVEQVAPKPATLRVPGGDRQALLVFTKGADAKEYAVPVGYKQDGQYTFYTDEIFFYDDPHVLYKHWGPEVWKAVDEHRAILGMSESQVQMALGQVSKSVSKDRGNRLVTYDNLGKPYDVTFVKNKAVKIVADPPE